MNAKMQNPADSLHKSILGFWHKIEFFIPFDLDRQVLEARDADTVRMLSLAQLAKSDAASLWQANLPADRRLTSFELYLGVFDKRELVEVTQQVVHETLTPDEEYEQEARGELEGPTCFARIKLNVQGEPILGEVSVSTAPWALGQIQLRGLEGLNFDAFQAGLDTLKEDLKNFRASRVRQPQPAESLEAGADPVPAQPLTASEILELLDVFYAWAGHRPVSNDAAAAIVIRPRSTEIRATRAAKPPESAAKTDEQDGDSDVEAEDEEIDILNSFFARDIARAISSLARSDDCSTLAAYLTPIPEGERINLYQSTGRQHIIDAVHPARLNTGHWPDRPIHAMSLMQQFAINRAFEHLTAGGIVSVNGPPGTGKTTLLRDIFAENIVRRARVLAKYETSDEAFHPEAVTLNFAGVNEPCRIAQLREELAGFEMVVASTNNAAVENISRDLPKTESLGLSDRPHERSWRDADGRATFGYLKTVAHNIAAKNGKGEYDELSIKEEPWGLIACALGKKANRDAFVQRLNVDVPKSADKPPKGYDPEKHQSLWTWRRNYRGPSFTQARQSFLTADRKVKETLKQLERYATLHAELRGQTEAGYTALAAHHEQNACSAWVSAQSALRDLDTEWALCNSQLDGLRAEEQLITATRPGFLSRLLKRPAYLEYQSELAANHRQQRDWFRRRRTIQERRLEAQKAERAAAQAYRQTEDALAKLRADWHGKLAKLEQLARDFPQAECPPHPDDLEQEHWQIEGLWWGESLNAQRSELFVAALQLHEAWLAEVMKAKRFIDNVFAISHLLSGYPLIEKEHAISVWRSLFMVVPVVSSTFASFATQFRDLGPKTLGWLFIDEAGQAVPQAAVGALWRAQRAVVVGDPLQIEPVFTVPIKLIEALAKTSGLPAEPDVSPHRVSVQYLADAANRFGTYVDSSGHEKWIGSPLRVHRRCVDPMFSLANEIAYEGKMIFYNQTDPAKRLPPPDSLDLGPSAWVCASGSTDGKQSVPAQIDLVHRAVVALYQRTGVLPPLYIISPFRRIKEELYARISNHKYWVALMGSDGPMPPKKTSLQVWCKKRIGTVHTFQGKEESIVWMVLGCDDTTQGAANWASSKPNLLNVALTRAKHRFFMIGDAGLWGGQRHFVAANPEMLPRLSPDEFLRRMELPGSARRGEEAASDA